MVMAMVKMLSSILILHLFFCFFVCFSKEYSKSSVINKSLSFVIEAPEFQNVESIHIIKEIKRKKKKDKQIKSKPQNKVKTIEILRRDIII